MKPLWHRSFRLWSAQWGLPGSETWTVIDQQRLGRPPHDYLVIQSSSGRLDHILRQTFHQWDAEGLIEMLHARRGEKSLRC